MRATRLVPLALALPLIACSAGAYSSVDEIPEQPSPRGASGHFGLGLLAHRSPFVADGALRTLRDLMDAMPGASSPSVRVEYVYIYPSAMTLRVHRGGVDFDDWRWGEGTITGPTPQRGTSEADVARVFSTSSVAWTSVPDVFRQSLESAHLEGGRVSSITLSVVDGQVQFSAFVQGTRHDATFTFDAAGHFIK